MPSQQVGARNGSMLSRMVRLYESPMLRVQTPEETVELSLEKLDSVRGFRQDEIHVRSVLEKAAAMDRGEGGSQAVVEAIRLWFLHAFGTRCYERVFSTPRRRESFAWHEKVFLAAREALAAARAAYLDAAADGPELRALRERAAMAAVARGGADE